MIQGRGTARLIFEPAQLCLVRRQAIREKLERGFAPESLVARQINLAHSAYADERLDPVMTNQFSDQRTGAVGSCQFGSDFECWYFDKILRALMRSEQRLYLAAHAFVIVARFIKKGSPFLRCTFDG